MTRFILIRHGQTAWNKVERFRGQVDVPLDDIGLAQAEATAERVATDWRPSAVYCSPLKRAVQTAQAIARRLGREAQPLQGFIDIDFGKLKGLTAKEARERWPKIASAWFKKPHTVDFPQGESLQIVRDRNMRALRRVIEQHPGQDVAIVAHNVVNRVLLCAMLGLENSDYWRIWQDTCAINVIEWRHNMFIVLALNDTCHLRVLETRAPLTQAAPARERAEPYACKVTIYTDGACQPNPGPGGWAALLLYGDHEQVLSGSDADSTNNRMELQAAISALETLAEPCHVELYTDSTYLQQGITQWLERWIARGWRKSDRRPVLNVDQWQKLHALTQEHDVQWHWVRGHGRDRHNERVDRLAYGAIPGPGSAGRYPSGAGASKQQSHEEER
jgi:ribonuclease HI